MTEIELVSISAEILETDKISLRIKIFTFWNDILI